METLCWLCRHPLWVATKLGLGISCLKILVLTGKGFLETEWFWYLWDDALLTNSCWFYAVLPKKSQGYVQVFLDGGLNQQRMGVSNKFLLILSIWRLWRGCNVNEFNVIFLWFSVNWLPWNRLWVIIFFSFFFLCFF